MSTASSGADARAETFDDAALRATFAQQARERYALLKIGVLALLALACAIPFSLNLVDPSLYHGVAEAFFAS